MIKEDRAILEKHRAAVNAFKAFVTTPPGNDPNGPFEATDYYDFSLDFFIALGVSVNTNPDEEGDAFALARIVRYALQYWDGTGEPD